MTPIGAHVVAGAAHALAVASGTVPAMTSRGLDLVRRIEERNLAAPQVDIATHHVIHAGIYSRTICIPAGVVLTGALIKIATTLVVCGRASVIVGDGEEVLIDGYRVLACSVGRKQAFIAWADTWLTMSFKTDALTVEEAEGQFTDEAALLFSREGRNEIVITGE